MTDAEQGTALLRAILDDPADDAARLVYADWLEEAGDPYAAVIRRMMKTPLSAEGYVTGFVLFGRGTAFSIPHGCELIFRRGFVERIVCTLDAWIEHGAAIVAAHPVTRVELTDKEPWGGTQAFGEGWSDGGSTQHDLLASYELPVGVWNVLPKPDGFAPGAIWKWYADEPAATDAASDALLAWAKSRAGKLSGRR